MNANRQKICYGYTLLQVIIILVSPLENQGKDCGEISRNECLEKLVTFLNLTSLPFLTQETQKYELDKLCDNAEGGHRCFTEMVGMPGCLTPENKDLFPVYNNMAGLMSFMFCGKEDYYEKGSIRNLFLQNWECMFKQKKAVDCCAEQSRVPVLPIIYTGKGQSNKLLTERQISACCSISDYIKCVENVLQFNCGKQESLYAAKYIKMAAGEEVSKVCQKSWPLCADPYLSEKCDVFPSVRSGSRILGFNKLIALLNIIFVVWTCYIRNFIIK